MNKQKMVKNKKRLSQDDTNSANSGPGGRDYPGTLGGGGPWGHLFRPLTHTAGL